MGDWFKLLLFGFVTRFNRLRIQFLYNSFDLAQLIRINLLLINYGSVNSVIATDSCAVAHYFN